MNHSQVWESLALEPTTDAALIKRAYAARIRTYRPDTHPKEFSEIRQAYEMALYLARREAQQVQTEATATTAAAETTEAGGATTATEALAGGDEAVVQAPSASVVIPVEEAAADVAFSAQAWLQALWRCQSERGDAAARALLHKQFAALHDQTIDAKLDYEANLLHGLLCSATPPLAVLFEGARLFQWPRRRGDVVQMFGEGGAQRLGLLMDMAYEYTHARYFSSNRWNRKLFDATVHSPPWYGSLVHVYGARAVANYWQRLCEAGNLPEMRSVCNPVVVQRLQGWLLLSTDAVFAALVGIWVWTQWADAFHGAQAWIPRGLAAVVVLAALALPSAWRWFMGTAVFRRLVAARATFSNVPIGVGVVVVPVLIFLALVASDNDGSAMVRWAGKATLAGFAAVIVVVLSIGVWQLLRYLEIVSMRPWVVLQRASDAQAFEQVRSQQDSEWHSPTLVVRARALPAAVQHGWAERKRAKQLQAQRLQESQERARAARPFFSTSGGESSNHWWVWFAVLMLINVIRTVAK